MNLLPKSHQDFGQKDYWNTFFKKRGKSSFDWYGEYPELCGNLHKYIKQKDNILVVGCGNSKLSPDLYDIGIKQITNIDISQVVIKQMLDINKTVRPDMKFINMDATNMSFENDEFSVILDKGTLDALMSDESKEVKVTILKYFSEISRVLRIGGRFICISLLQEHIIKELLEYFPEHSWMFRVVRCFEAEQKTAETSNDGASMPVFIVIATKFKQLPQKILEVCMGGEKMLRLQTIDEVCNAVSEVQKAALVCNGLHRGPILNEEVSLDLFQPDGLTPRFTIHILDQTPVRGNGKYAAFIVPQGRETEWLFSTPEGRKKLLTSAHHDRLAIVSMHREQIYTTWDNVKDELSQSVKSLAPHGLKEQIPYLSLGSEVGQREIIFKGQSELSGEYIVEEIAGDDGKIFRRLIFLNNQFVIQSEALVKTIKQRNKQLKKVIDFGHLACNHHLYMAIGTRMSIKDDSGSCCVIGLGGGGLCTFIHQCLKSIKITAIDIDPAMLEIAKQFFGLNVGENLKVIIDDGIVFLRKSTENNDKYSVILFDVDSKDPKLGMSCPPQSFLDDQVLKDVKFCLGETGIFILNLVCRDEKLRENILNKLKIFKSICSYKLNEDVNEIIYCSDNNYNIVQWKLELEKAAKDINLLVKKYKISSNEMIDVESFLEELQI